MLSVEQVLAALGVAVVLILAVLLSEYGIPFLVAWMMWSAEKEHHKQWNVLRTGLSPLSNKTSSPPTGGKSTDRGN